MTIKRHYSIFIAFLCALTSVVAQEAVFKDYNNFIKLVRIDSPSGTPFFAKTVTEVSPDLKGAHFINEQRLFWDYLVNNYSQPIQEEIKSSNKSIVVLEQMFIESISKDSLFTPLVSKYTAQVLDSSMAKDTLFMDDLLNVAVKFFNVLNGKEAGQYIAKVCVGVNEIKQTEIDRHAFAEAFIFNAIMTNLRNERYALHDYFIETIRNIIKLNLGIDDKDRILRAQGAIYIQMLQYDNLRLLLEDEYASKKDLLPFVLGGNSN